jgi:hypothetical protein
MGVLYFLGEEPVQNDQQQECCLIVEVHAPDGVDNQWAEQAAGNAMEEQFGRRLTLWSVNEEEAFQYLQAESGATHGYLELGAGVPMFWHLLPAI